MSKIVALTTEQQDAIPGFRSEYFRWGTSTDRADHSKAEASIMAMRAEIGITTKPIFIWCQSPATSLLAVHVLKSKQWKTYVSDLRKSLGGDPPLGDSLGDSLWASLWASLRDSLGDSLRASLYQAWWGQHESYWIAFYLFCRDLVGVKFDEKRSRQLDMWRNLAQSCCWWWCYENYVIISERPTACHMTEQEGRLHCENGPALSFGDGYSLWRWHGVAVPEDVVMHPEQLTVARIDAEGNAEVRRVMLERYGEARYVQDSGAKPIHGDKCGTLYRKEIPGDEPPTDM